MIIRVDIDNTICRTNGCNYSLSTPIKENIAKINKLYDSGNEIIYWSSRGVGSGKNLHELTIQQFVKWGVKYHKLELNKPVFDYLIDDRTMLIEDVEKNLF